MKLTVEYLKELNACASAIEFVQRNKLEGFPLSRLNEVKGDHAGYIDFLYIKLGENYDANSNMTHRKDSDGYEYWKTYDDAGNLIHFRSSYGDEYRFEHWREYDENNNEIHFRSSDGFEYWKTYDAGNLIHYKDTNGYEYWKTYDDVGNEIHYKDTNGYEYWKTYDAGNLIHYKDTDGFEYWNRYDDEAGNIIYYKNSYGAEGWRAYDEAGNLIRITYKNIVDFHSLDYCVEYYDDGQLKKYVELEIPWFEKGETV